MRRTNGPIPFEGDILKDGAGKRWIIAEITADTVRILPLDLSGGALWTTRQHLRTMEWEMWSNREHVKTVEYARTLIVKMEARRLQDEKLRWDVKNRMEFE